MPSNYVKRIENSICKMSDGTYTMVTKKIFVPAHNSKRMFHGIEVQARNETVIMYGTPPAQKHLAGIYENALSAYFKTLYGHKKLKRSINTRIPQRTA